ncbi:very short patch repair endonuclease [Microvirga antarctica]|uniref:very short patch repair endonuclease n=1 Tax=Microvirga antarctica TaxID=2819233 RepID=UPI001B30AA99|nr:very short patch repair endonuclease [Microvirga antarctica]
MSSVDPKRSSIMASVKGKNTKPEIIVRQTAHAMGYRYRLHRRDLPGTPDLVFVRLKKVIFVHGCFWHRHENCRKATTPLTRADFWQDKFNANVKRDLRNITLLQGQGWSVLIVWECETRDITVLREKLRSFLKAVPRSDLQYVTSGYTPW